MIVLNYFKPLLTVGSLIQKALNLKIFGLVPKPKLGNLLLEAEASPSGFSIW